MAVYEYVGLNAAGKSVNGIIDADSPRAARARLRKQGVFPTDVREQKPGAATRGKGLAVEIDLKKYFTRVSAQDLAQMTSQLATLVGAAIPMVEALGALVEQTENEKLKAVLAEVKEKVNEGSSLAKAMRAHPDVFNDLFVNMIDAGEKSGAMEVVLERLTRFTESQVQLQGKLVSALTYPILMMGMSSLILLGLFTFVIPRIQRTLESFGQGLPLLTQVVFSISTFVTGYWYLVLLVGVGAVVGWVRWIRRPTGRAWWHRTQLQLPIFGPLLRKVAVSRFARTLSTLLASGVPILTALDIVKSVVGNDRIAAAVESAGKNIAEGQSIAGPLRASGEFEPIVIHMITVGERTGELESMLSKLSDAYDQVVENTVNALTSLMTPVLTVFMGIVVAIVALSILLPMLSLSSSLGNH